MVTITLKAWAYEHIVIAHPNGLPNMRFSNTTPYALGNKIGEMIITLGYWWCTMIC